MPHSFCSFAVGAVCALAVVTLPAPPAQAGIADCGNIDVDASASCKVVTSNCDVECAPLSFDAACAGSLEASCESNCSLPTVDCSGSCEGTCNTTCTAQPATFTCEGNCTGTCGATCSGKCDSAADKTECEAQCNATCSGECQASCKGQPATVDCNGDCHASCQGSCKADLNMDCQTQCQAKGFASCKANLQGGCKVQCEDPKGAVICNGEFVDRGGNADACVNALKEYLASHVVASGSSDCTGNTCEAQGKVSASCQFAPQTANAPSALGALIAGLSVVGGAVRRRVRRG